MESLSGRIPPASPRHPVAIPPADETAVPGDTAAPLSGESPAPRRLSLPGRPGFPDWAICLGLAVSILAVYARVAGFDFVNYDDDLYVYSNSHVAAGLSWATLRWAFSSIVVANWIPVTLLSYLLEVRLFGMHSGLHHMVNVLFHALASWLLYASLRRATGARAPSAFVAFVFALHPLHVSSVAWIAERKDVLSAFFGFLALYAYIRYAERPGPVRFLAVAGAFALGLLSKPMLVTFPFTLLLLDLWPLRRLSWPKTFLEKLPLIAIAAAASVVTYFVQLSGGALRAVPPMIRAGNALISYIIYLRQTFWPLRLAVLYPYPAAIPAWQQGLAFAFLATITAVAIRDWRTRPWLTVGWLWFAGTLVPVIGVIQVGAQAHADRYMYIPLVGLSIVLAWGAEEVIARWPQVQRLVAGAGLAVCLACLALSWREVSHWRNSETLWTRAIEVTEKNAEAYNNLGSALYSQGRYAEAVPYFHAALRARPDHAQAHFNLGLEMKRRGDQTAAIAYFRDSIRDDPGYVSARYNLGLALAMRGDYDAAIPQLEAALKVQPDHPEANNNMGVVLVSRGQFTAALPYFEASLRAKPDYAEAHYNFGMAKMRVGDYAGAIPQFEDAIRTGPDNDAVRCNLGEALLRAGNAAAAVPEFDAALRFNPGYMAAHLYRGAAFSQIPAASADALARYEAALRNNPADAGAHAGFGGLLSGLGRTPEAIAQLAAAQRLHPDPTVAEALHALRPGPK